MRRMYSKEQIKKLIEEDMSNVTVTKGQYTTDADIKVTKVGHCITIMGYVKINNTTGASITGGLKIIEFNNLTLGDTIDGDCFVLAGYHNNNNAFANANITNDGQIIVRSNVITGITEFWFDVDLIDSNYLPVLDYPGE